MTRSDFMIKWGVYALAILPIWFLEVYVLNRLPVLGVTPMLMPLAAVAAAVLEGATGGAGYGLFVGILCDAAYHGTNGAMTLGLCLLCCACGAAAWRRAPWPSTPCGRIWSAACCAPLGRCCASTPSG